MSNRLHRFVLLNKTIYLTAVKIYCIINYCLMVTKIKFKEVKTQRYVYHLTYSVNRESILEKGLIGSDHYEGLNKPVFAHNNPIPSMLWYPYIIDSWDWTSTNQYTLIVDSIYDYLKFQSLSVGYDVWEIDTYKMNNVKWYIDYSVANDFLDGINYPYYVFTEGWIPSSVLRLYTFNEEHICTFKDGVAHIRPDFRPFEY